MHPTTGAPAQSRSATPASAADSNASRAYSYYTSSTRVERPQEGSSAGSASRREGRARSNSASNGVETTVTRLLVAIKQLLESLTLWSQQKMTENQVSDVYVRLGNDFNAAVAAFAGSGIDMSELLSVPQDLRDVLELCLAEDAVPGTLERYLPTVRSIITNLLNGLRQKQSDYRQIQAIRPSRSSGNSRSSRHSQSDNAPPEETRAAVTPSGSRSREHRSVPAAAPSTQAGSGSRRPTGISLDETRSSSSLSNAPGERFVGGFVPQRRREESLSGRPPPPQEEAGPSSRPQSRTSGRVSSRLPPIPTGAQAGHDSAQQEASRQPPPQRGTSLTGLGISMIPEEPPTPTVAEQPRSPLPSVPPEVKRYSLSDNPVSPPLEDKYSPSPPAPSPLPANVPGSYPTPSEHPESKPAKQASPPARLVSPPPDVVVQEASPHADEADDDAAMEESREEQPPATGDSSEDVSSPLPPAASEGVPPLDPTTVDSARVTTLGAQSSLAALQRSDMLERRASKRFSTFNFMRMGASGPSAREKQTAQLSHNRRSMVTQADLPPLPEGEESSRAAAQEASESSRSRSSERSIHQAPSPTREEPVPPLPPLPAFVTAQKQAVNGIVKSDSVASVASVASDVAETSPVRPPVVPAQSVAAAVNRIETSASRASLSSNLTIFLSLGMQTKKAEIEPSISFAGLRVLFMDRFTYNPGLENFPAIYIEDPGTRVRYELENLDDIQNGSRLLLNVEPLDQVKQHIDLQISAVSQDIRELKMAIAASRRMSLGPVHVGPSPATSPPAPRPSDVQFQAAASKLSRMKTDSAPSSKPPAEPIQPQVTGVSIQPQTTGASDVTSSRIIHDLQTQFDEVQNIRRDLGVMRQLYVDFINQTKEALGGLRVQTNAVRELANTKVGGTRAYINEGKVKLDTRSQTALTRIEELTDSVESLKGDVVRRQVVPKPSIMRSLKSDIDSCSTELESLTQHIATIKPMWKKTWGEELENIVEEQKFLTHQEELLTDLVEDHKALKDVYGHVEKFIALKGTGGSQRSLRSFRPPPVDENHGGLSTVMMEIRGAAVDPERRLRAIAAAQKQRDKELASRSDEFQAELSNFVDGKKLKLTGGADEVERVRQKRNEQTLKAMFSPNSSNSLPDIGSPITPASPPPNV